MQIDICLATALDHPVLRQAIERRAQSTLTRLTPELSELRVHVSPRTHREGGETTCRVSGALRGGGTLHVSGSDPRPHRALDTALRRFRRSMRRTLDRRTNPRADRTPAAAQ